MKQAGKILVAAAIATVVATTGAMAQNPYADDMACRQYADSVIAPYQGQGAAAAAGSALVGAGLGAALGAAIGGGRGAGIGAATGAIAGTGVGASNAQQYSGQLAAAWQSYYASCMQQRQGYAQPGYGAPPPGYGYPGYYR